MKEKKPREPKKASLVRHYMADGSILYNDEIDNYTFPYGLPPLFTHVLMEILSDAPKERAERMAEIEARKSARII